MGIYYPVLINRFAGNREGIFLPNAIDELTLFGNIFIVGVMICVSFWGISAKLRTIKHPELLEKAVSKRIK